MEPKLWAFLELVQQMRKKQVEYFTKGRDANVLFESKELERKVDKMARDLQDERHGFFLFTETNR